jgi:hypothetical protein
MERQGESKGTYRMAGCAELGSWSESSSSSELLPGARMWNVGRPTATPTRSSSLLSSLPSHRSQRSNRELDDAEDTYVCPHPARESDVSTWVRHCRVGSRGAGGERSHLSRVAVLESLSSSSCAVMVPALRYRSIEGGR